MEANEFVSEDHPRPCFREICCVVEVVEEERCVGPVLFILLLDEGVVPMSLISSTGNNVIALLLLDSDFVETSTLGDLLARRWKLLFLMLRPPLLLLLLCLQFFLVVLDRPSVIVVPSC